MKFFLQSGVVETSREILSENMESEHQEGIRPRQKETQS
jgi:hypothetical protein